MLPEISDKEAAPFSCAGMTTYAGVQGVAAFPTGEMLTSVVGYGGAGFLVVWMRRRWISQSTL